MPSIFKSRALLFVMLFVVGASLGCRPSSDTDSGDGNVVDTGPPGTPSVSPSPASLNVGDPAPALSIDRWVTGDPITALELGQVYVIEFWATWCPPCRASMPHLSQLQQQYGDQVQFIGVTKEPEATVQGFLDKPQSEGKTWTEVVTYRLATDSADATSEAYMQAAGQNGIPTAFIVGVDGLIEWIGHPMMMDDILAQIVAGDWDREAAIVQLQQRERLKEISTELDELVRGRQWDEALARLDQVEEDLGQSSETSRMRLTILHRAGRTEAASAVRVKLIELLWDNPSALNGIAWEIATEGGGRDLDTALKAAQRASELREDQDAAILDTLARVYYERGELDEAIGWQKKAAERNQGMAEIDAALSKYEAEKAAQSVAPDSETPDDAAADDGSQ